MTKKKDMVQGKIHQKYSNGTFYTSGNLTDGREGRYISVGDKKNHTTNIYDKKGNYIESKTRGDGGYSKDKMTGQNK